MVNGVGFVISEEENLVFGTRDEASGTQSFRWQKFVYSAKEIEKVSDINFTRGQRVTNLGGALYTFSIGYWE